MYRLSVLPGREKKSLLRPPDGLEYRNPGGALAVGKYSEFGSITKGKKADLILLNANPVDSLENLQKISLVINKGSVISPDTLVKVTPVSLVQRQLNAYNARNIDAFLEPYSDDIKFYDYPGKLLGKGKDALRKTYANVFAKVPLLHCEVKSRVVQSNRVIDDIGYGINLKLPVRL